METPPHITFRNMDRSEPIEAHVRARIRELEKYHPRITSCDVVIEAPRKQQKTGTEYMIRLNIQVPGPDVHVARSLGRSEAAADLNLAIHRAFDAARRTLKEQVRKMGRIETKHHPEVMLGHVDRIVPGSDYGFIRLEDGREIYFERDNLTSGDWDALAPGTRVRFRQETGPKGAYAINVGPAE